MVDTHWDTLRGERVRYLDHTWELTGDVTVQEQGALLGVNAIQVDDVRHGRATLYFDLADPPNSLNPTDMSEHFDRLEQDGDDQVLQIRKGPRTYRYRLHRLEPN